MYVIVNSTEDTLMVAQQDCTDSPYVIEPTQRKPFFWKNGLAPKNVHVKLLKKEPMYMAHKSKEPLSKLQQMHMDENSFLWSGAFPLNSLGVLSVRLANKNKRNARRSRMYQILKVQKRLKENTVFMIVENEDL
jgi:hypothetical protein